MKFSSLGLVALALASPAFAQSAFPPIPEIKFESDHNFLKLPVGMNFGDPVSVSVSPVTGDIFVANRSNISGPAFAPLANEVLVFDKSGKFKHELAPRNNAKSYIHAVRVDKEGFVWVVDKGSDMIIKIEPKSQHVVMVFGRRGESSDKNGQGPRFEVSDKEHGKVPPPQYNLFRMPTDVAWDAQGNTYISDGYVNSRVAVFDKNGAPLDSFGEFGHGPAQFSTAHNIAVGPNGDIYVADRANDRIQIFTPERKFKKEVRLTSLPVPPGYGGMPWMENRAGSPNPNAPWSLCITPGPKPVLYVGSGFPNRIFKLTLEGKVIGAFGHTGKGPGEFGWIHGLACPSENLVWAADELNWRIHRLTLHPDKAAEAAAEAAQK
jgi:6-phosphogluconolactonase (cycloisomerase 2 family)